MADSPAHRWGQIIGEVMEQAVLPILTEFARKHDLYLDQEGERACRKGKKCTWGDRYGNAHDLDFVLERGGSDDQRGTPVAFIETAWRRYTKHSRNKAQEIQGAILPLAETYAQSAPFKGAILGGVFTEGALSQMRSLGFTILYFPYEAVLKAFREFGMDAASEEDTPDSRFRRKIRLFCRLSERRRWGVSAKLVRLNASQVQEFVEALHLAVSRRIERVIVLPLHGSIQELASIEEAIAFVQGYNASNGRQPLQRYEIQIKYSNGDVIEGRFVDKEGAIEFLKNYVGTPAS